MAKKKEIRAVLRLKSTQSDHVYYTEKNRRNTLGRLELRKYDPVVRRHVIYRESK
ncbi:MAG: 50S ribosomal protein L33 [Anaerolineae bacterium]|nr:50S ribosomal protein L33 [Anaerolineae bacterium]